MVKLESITEHVAVDITTQRESRSCVLSGIALDDYLIAVDSGHSLDVGMALRQKLEKFFQKPVKFLFLSHTHNDHREGRDAFKDTTLIVNHKCLDNMPKRIRLGKWSKEVFSEQFVLNEGHVDVEFHHVGGHSVGHSVVYFPSEKVLFGCDLFIVRSINFGLPFMGFYQNKPKKTGNPEEYLSAYRKFKSMDIEIIVPGHGDLVTNPQKYLDEQISFFKSLKKHFVSAIREGKKLDEIKLLRFGPIEQAYATAESRRQRSMNLRFLENYLQHLKASFYNYYEKEEF